MTDECHSTAFVVEAVKSILGVEDSDILNIYQWGSVLFGEYLQ